MRFSATRRMLAPALALSLLALAPAEAKDFQAGPIKIGSPWTRVTPPKAAVAGGFMTLTNTGKEADRLMGGSVAISKRFEVHEMSMEGGVMKMGEIKGGLEIKPGQTVTLQPGGLHVMFMDITDAPKAGTPVKGTLQFQKAGKVDIEYSVEPLGAKAPAGAQPAAAGAGAHHGKH